MFKQKKWLLAVMIWLMVVVMTSGVVFASNDVQQNDPPTSLEGKVGPEGGRAGRGEGLDEAVREALDAAMNQALVDATGLSLEEIESRLEAGERPHEIAESAGIDDEAFKMIMNEAIADFVEQALSDGLITEEQATMMLEHGQGPRGGRKDGSRPGMSDGEVRGDCPPKQQVEIKE